MASSKAWASCSNLINPDIFSLECGMMGLDMVMGITFILIFRSMRGNGLKTGNMAKEFTSLMRAMNTEGAGHMEKGKVRAEWL